jgi:hypothetical protein
MTSMLKRNLLLTALAATASASLFQSAAVAEATAAAKVIVAVERGVDAPSFRAEIDSYVREVNERLRTTLSEDLKRELGKKIVIGSHSLPTRG